MAIKIGENPEGAKGINKYIETDGDGWRGVIIALNKDHTEAIIKGDSRGGLLLVREDDPKNYPIAIRTVKKIPKGFDLVKVQK